MQSSVEGPFLTLGLSQSNAVQSEEQSEPVGPNLCGIELEQGERVIWEGKPNMDAWHRRAIICANKLAPCFLIVPLIVAYLSSNAGLIVLVVYGAAYGFFLYKLGSYNPSSPETVYAITDRRVMRWSCPVPTAEKLAYRLNQIRSRVIVPYSGEVGTLVFNMHTGKNLRFEMLDSPQRADAAFTQVWQSSNARDNLQAHIHQNDLNQIPKKDWGETWGGTIIWSLMLGACLIYVMYQKHQLDLYHVSPGCVAGYEADPNLSPCTWTTMRLSGKWEREHPKGGTDYGFNLIDSSGMRHSIQIHSSFGGGLFGLAKERDSVQTKIWRGSIVVLRDRGVTSLTMDRPGISGLTVLWVMLSGSGLGVALFGVLCRFPK